MPRPVYATIQDLRDEGLSVSIYPDARALVLLERAADTVERVTNQRFGPKREHFLRDGRNGRMALHPKAYRLIEVETVMLRLPDGTTFNLNREVFSLYPRYIRLRRGDTGLPSDRAVREGGESWTLNNYSKTRREISFPDDNQNVEVWGTFGIIEPSVVISRELANEAGAVLESSKEETTLGADLNMGDTSLRVVNVGTIRADDVLHIDPQGANFWVIVQGVFRWVDVTTEALATAGVQVKIANIAQAQVGDKVTISSGVVSVTVTVTAIDVPNSRIQFAAVTLSATIAAGATVRAQKTAAAPGAVTIDPAPESALATKKITRWGMFPRDLKEAVLRTVFAQKGGLSDASVGDRYRLKREKTDNYEYEFFGGIEPASVAAGTGDPRADSILSRFRAPPFASYV